MGKHTKYDGEFAACPRGELLQCFFYEYSRAIEDGRKEINRWRSTAVLEEATSTEESPALAKLGTLSHEFEKYRAIQPPAMDYTKYGAGYAYFPEWPAKGYLKIPEKTRTEYLNRLRL